MCDGELINNAEDGDIYFNSVFGDLWIVIDDKLILINKDYEISIDEPVGFERVGKVNLSLLNKERKNSDR